VTYALHGHSRDGPVDGPTTGFRVRPKMYLALLAAFQALYAAEGSDWFWWFGEDQDSGNDGEFDDLFMAGVHRHHLTIGPLPETAAVVRFQCTHPGCDCGDACCRGDEYTIRVERPPVWRTR
jgi:hypothetical protein